MRIVHVLGKSSRNAGGLFEVVPGLAHSMQHLPGVEVSAVGVADELSASSQLQWKCPLHAVPASPLAPKKLLYAPGMFDRLVAEDASVVFCHGLWNYHNRVVLRWARQTRRPYVIVPHGMLDIVDLNKSRISKWLVRKLYMEQLFKGAACVRAISLSEVESVRAYGVRAPICLIPNGITEPPAGKAEPPPWNQKLPANAKILFYIGRINPKKGLPALIEAWSQAKRSDPSGAKDWHLVIAGWDQDGHELTLKSLVEKFASGSTVHFVGPLFDAAKDAAFRNSDAFILPSKSEGLPTVVLEAWAYERPVLMTPQCNIPEGFTSRAALQIETNATSISEGLRQLFLMGAAERRELAANGKNLVAGKFSWASIGHETLGMCRWLLGLGPKPACVIDG